MAAKKKSGTPKQSPPADAGLVLPEPRKIRLAEINFAPYNPRTMSRDKMRALKASVLKHGLVLNLVVQLKGLVLIGGHQRVTAVREICAERKWPVPVEVWATVLDVDDTTARQLNVALNKIDGDFDPTKLAALFAPLAGEMTVEDILATGFTPEAFADLTRGPEEDKPRATLGKSITLSVPFASVVDRDAAKVLLQQRMAAMAGTEKKPGALLLEWLRATA